MNRDLLDQVRRLADDRRDYLLAINDPDAVAFRGELMEDGVFL